MSVSVRVVSADTDRPFTTRVVFLPFLSGTATASVGGVHVPAGGGVNVSFEPCAPPAVEPGKSASSPATSACPRAASAGFVASGYGFVIS